MTMTSGVGTPFFMAPEMATGTKHYTGAVDVYSFAIMAAHVMTGKLVYDSSDVYESQYGLCKKTTMFDLTFSLFVDKHSVYECSVPRTSTSCV